ncbi:desmoplakin-A-like [Stigmatopora nigra]
MATGGVVDPNASLRLPADVAVKRGLLDEPLQRLLLQPDDNSKGFFDPNTRERLSYLQLTQLVQQYKSSALTQKITEILTAIIAEVSSEEKKLDGLSKQISVGHLLAEVSSEEKNLQGEVTVDNGNKMESVHKYLGATNCIAGVRVESTKKVMSIYKAKSRGLLPPGTSLILLEAQTATGFLIAVEKAVAQRVVGSELKEKLLSAQLAVSGYTDPDTKETISLFQALNKELIVKDHGIRLLEAQIATGGIIDPLYSHRVPVQVAYQRGYFDQEMKRILSDPDDDTKGFFDPNTQEYLTYLQLLERCITDPTTGLSLLPLRK